MASFASDEFDLQPDPRILPMLGEINLPQWRCLAELVDNSIDSFLSAHRGGHPLASAEIAISVPTVDGPSAKATIRDNGPGMDPATLEKAVRAGWTSNDPMHNLGMFGMGFNIATARLGSATTVWTTRDGDAEWHGLEIDFDKLIQQRHFRTPRLTRPKIDPHEQGTEIIIERLKPEQRQWFAKAANRSKLSRDHFGIVYAAMLRPNGVPLSFRLQLNGAVVVGRSHCVWGGEGNAVRQVATARYGIVNAYQSIDTRLADRDFCVKCWQWLPHGESVCPACSAREHVVTRQRRVYGWLGVQRYVHESDYGVDFLRHGRKIEVASKDLFVWDAGGTVEPEYPIDDPRHRGRLVGEIHIDHCRVTYTKDRFDRNDPAWEEMIRIVRGDGPLRPDRASELGHGPNGSPLFLLFQAFRRNQPHQKVAGAYAKLLAIRDNDQAEAMAKKFYAGEPDCQTDTKWWDLVEETDRALLAPSGQRSGSQTGSPVPGFGGARTPDTTLAPPPPPLPRLALASLTREYQDSVTGQRWNVRAFRVHPDDPGLGGPAVPWAIKATPEGVHEYYVNDRHEVFRSATLTPLDSLLAHLAWSAMDFVRSGPTQATFASVLASLRNDYATISKLDPATLATDATSALGAIAKSLVSNVGGDDAQVLFNELSPTEQQAIQTKMATRALANPQQAIAQGRFLEYAPWPLLLRFFETHADLFFDGRYWDAPYASLDYGHAAATEAARTEIRRYYSSLIADAAWLADQDLSQLAASSRSRVLRCALAVDLLAAATSNDSRA